MAGSQLSTQAGEVQFGADGRLSGSFGGIAHEARYTVDGGRLGISGATALHVERAAAEDLRAAVPVYLALELAHLYTSRYNDGRPGPHGDVLALYMPDGQVAVRFTAATYEQDAQRPNRPAKTRSAEIFEWLQRDPNDARAWETLRLHVRSWAQAHLRGRDEAAVEETVAETCARVGASLHTARAETFGGFVSVQYLAARRAILQRRDSV